MTYQITNGINTKKEEFCIVLEEIEKLKRKLDKEIEMGCSYSQILKTSKEIDVLLAEYYLKDVKDIT